MVETYVVVQILYVLSSYFLQHKPFTWDQLYIPNAAAWFLLSLISWRLLYQMLPNSLLESKWLLPMSIIISLLAGLIPIENELSLQRTMSLLPFFTSGYLLKHKIEFGKTTKSIKWFSGILLTLLIVVSFYMLNRDISFVIHCNSNYYIQSHSILTLLALRALYLCIAFIMIFCILAVFPKVSHPTFLSRLGSDTLFYYVYHILVMRVGIIVIRHYHLPLSFPAMLLYTLFSMTVLFFLGKVGLFRWLLNPLSSIRNKQ